MPPTLRFPLVLNNLPLDSIGCYGRVCFHIENAGMGGMGWDGKGRDVMGWEWGWGEVRHVDKVGKIKRLVPTNHPQASLWRPFGFGRAASLWHPWGSCLRSFLSLGGCWCLLGPKLQKDTKIKRTSEQKLMPKGHLFSLFAG